MIGDKGFCKVMIDTTADTKSKEEDKELALIIKVIETLGKDADKFHRTVEKAIKAVKSRHGG